MARTRARTRTSTRKGRGAARPARRAARAGAASRAAGGAGAAERALAKLGLTLPPAPTSLANYVGAVVAGKLVFLSGHGPVRDGQLVYRGKLGRDFTTAEGYQA